MKFDCGPTWQTWVEQKSEWHPFFTILPRRVGENDCRFLETIERRLEYPPFHGICTWEYRAKP